MFAKTYQDESHCRRAYCLSNWNAIFFFHVALENLLRFHQKKSHNSFPMGKFPLIHHVNQDTPGKARACFMRVYCHHEGSKHT